MYNQGGGQEKTMSKSTLNPIITHLFKFQYILLEMKKYVHYHPYTPTSNPSSNNIRETTPYFCRI